MESQSVLDLKTNRDDVTLEFSTTKWDANMYQYIENVAKELEENQPFYVCDLTDVLWKIQQWKTHLPKVKLLYSVKTNTDPVLIRLMPLFGLGFNCGSQKELQMVVNAKVNPRDVIFSNTIKNKLALKYAESVGTDLMTFDCKDELLKIHSLFPSARLVLRLVPTNANCLHDLSEKFGCTMNDVKDLLLLAKEKNMNIIGTAFHVGTLCRTVNSYVSAISSCRQVFDMARQIGFHFTFLDIGGGFFGTRERHPIFIEVCQGIRAAIEKYFPGDEVQVVAEPGCYVAQSAYSLVTTVVGKRTIKVPPREHDQENPVQKYYYLNDGLYGSFVRYLHSYEPKIKFLLPEYEIGTRSVYKSNLYGPTCCSDDVVWRNCDLPEMQIGECIVWENMGAYCSAESTKFGGTVHAVTRHVFHSDERVNMDLFENKAEVVKFLESNSDYIQNT